MEFFEKLGKTLLGILRILCPPIHTALVSDYHESRRLKACLGFLGGFAMGMLYYNYLLRSIPFPHHAGLVLALIISVIMGVGNAVSVQVRCISLLTVPMYCGKAGRGVLKALVLTYVVAGPISNMGMNAREVVRVFACSTRLAYNVSRARYALMAEPFRKAIFGIDTEIGEVEDTFRSIREVVSPIEAELEGSGEAAQSKEVNDYVDQTFGDTHRSDEIEDKYKVFLGSFYTLLFCLEWVRVFTYLHRERERDIERDRERGPERYRDQVRVVNEDEQEDIYEKQYLKKVEYRCEDQLSRGTAICMEKFASAYDSCKKAMPWYASWLLCWPMKLTFVCNIVQAVGGSKICNSKAQIDPGLGEGYLYLKRAQSGLTKDFKDVKLQYRVNKVQDLVDVQDAKETGRRVIHAFEQKSAMMGSLVSFVNVCMALLMLKLILAAQDYHDKYLTSIEHDNIYITGYFKRIDARRDKKKKYTLLPLKKMERSRYIDVMSVRQVAAERRRLLTQALKVLLEVITATTFVMLDRLFYEALDVVRHYAEVQYTQEGRHDLDIQVDGAGMVAGVVRRVLDRLNTRSRLRRTLTNEPCLPRARATPRIYYIHIYGGYLWILLLLYVDAYTIRLRRLICSYIYPKREKQRILHLYNDILKKRMKMRRTLRQKAAQAVRAYYLSGESLLSLRLKFPKLLGWLETFPAARKKCLICGETQPRNVKSAASSWYVCPTCPFVYCPDCWRDCRVCFVCEGELDTDDDSLSDNADVRS